MTASEEDAARLGSPPASGTVFRRAPVVEHPQGDCVLLLPLAGGVADLRQAVALRGAGRQVWELLAEGCTAAEAAVCTGEPEGAGDARAFLEDLVKRGLALSGPEGDSVPHKDAADPGVVKSAPEPAGPIDAAAIEALARAVLSQGYRFRFLARGLSMRPQVPDGSVIEVWPAQPDAARLGEIVLYCAGAQRLVAHRVVGRRKSTLLTRGDSAARLDVVTPEDLLGVVRARFEALPGGGLREVRLGGAGRRIIGLITGSGHRCLVDLARLFVIGPLRGSPVLRKGLGFLLRGFSGVLRFGEDVRYRFRRRIDIVRAALLTPEEKDEGRRRLYAGRAVQGFTALDENIEAGLTLIEEVLLSRHPLPEKARVLVLGCGPGRECIALSSRGFDVTGLDREEGMLVQARNLAAREISKVRFVAGEATSFDLGGERFDAVVAFSGLYNMILPRERRLDLLRSASRHLSPRGRVLLTFLSDYVAPGSPPPSRRTTFLQAINPTHEPGDLYLLNEAVHNFPHPDLLAGEAREAGFEVADIWRDQRAYDRTRGQVRGYAVLVAAQPVWQ